jgi:hypothetical protein
MACEERKTELSRMVDGELAPERSAALLDHAVGCRPCAETLRRLRAERRLLESAFAGRIPARSPRRLPSRAALAAAVLLVLAGVGLHRLHGAYSAAAERAGAAARADLAEGVFLRTLRVEARGLPLTDFLTLVSEEAGVPLRLDEGALRRLGGPPTVHLVLVTPIRLGSLVRLLEDFYDLSAHATEDGVRLA